MTEAQRLLVRRRQIRAFVDQEPLQVVIQRRAQIETPGGGKRLQNLAPLPAQRARLVPAGSIHAETALTDEGSVERADYVLVFDRPNADVQKKDELVANGQRYEVVSVDLTHAHKSLAGVVGRGDA